MAEGGLGGILITSPMVSPDMLDRVRRLLRVGADLMLVVDHLDNVAALATLAEGFGRPLPLIVELDVGVGRTGCAEPEQALALAHAIAAAPTLRFAGIQAYWGNLQQVMPLAERQARVQPAGGAAAPAAWRC